MQGLLQDKDRIFTNLYGLRDAGLDAAIGRGAWNGAPEIIALGRDWILDQIKASGLKGRGGAGFSTGVKWSLMPTEPRPGRPHYLVVNADESEPGTCTNREILRHDPQLLLEGCLFAARAVGAHACYIFVRGEYVREREALERAVAEALQARLIGTDNRCGWDLEIVVHHSGGAYICGDETALLESLEGRKGQPRLKPPYPAAAGLYGCPTTVNNAETIAVVGSILRRGADWFASIGRPASPGVKLMAVSGHVARPCVVEEAMSIPLRQLIEAHAGGVAGGWRALKAVMPGGVSTPLIPAEEAETALMDWESLRSIGTAFGTAGVIVMDRSTDLVAVTARIARFFKHESCGQCTPCREGTGWMWRVLERMAAGDAEASEVDQLLDVSGQMEGHTICTFADAASAPIRGLFRHFRGEVEARIARYRTGRLLTPAARVAA